jgi:hypothetical protein
MCEKRNAYGILVEKSEGKKPLRRPRLGWLCNNKMDLRVIDLRWYGLNWFQDMDQRRALVKAVKNLKGSITFGKSRVTTQRDYNTDFHEEFPPNIVRTSHEYCQLSRKIRCHWRFCVFIKISCILLNLLLRNNTFIFYCSPNVTELWSQGRAVRQGMQHAWHRKAIESVGGKTRRKESTSKA